MGSSLANSLLSLSLPLHFLQKCSKRSSTENRLLCVQSTNANLCRELIADFSESISQRINGRVYSGMAVCGNGS